MLNLQEIISKLNWDVCRITVQLYDFEEILLLKFSFCFKQFALAYYGEHFNLNIFTKWVTPNNDVNIQQLQNEV